MNAPATRDQLGPYAILEKLGEGGMGEVYKARDTRLGRIVALKALPAGKVADEGRRRRFLQEARAASALNHPNIVTIYDWIEDAGSHILVMEHVPGRTLGQLIHHKALPLKDTLKYAVQVADALAAAHAAGITHRDVKPANIMVNEQGRVKILDFGLAKLHDPPQPGENNETLTARALTEEGTVAGSAPYMSPEQAEGKKVDARSDIFSFGAVLYEMITGRRAFQGSSQASIMAAVLKSEPKPASELAEVLPKELDRILTRCLRKDLDRRSQSMAEIRLELEEIQEESETGVERSVPGKRVSRRGWTPVAAAAALVLIAAGAWWWKSRSAGERPTQLSLRQLTADSGLTTHPVLSPDGKLVAYASDRATQKNLDIWVHPLTEGGQPIRITKHDADDFAPDFSPDGGLIVFQSSRDGGGIYLVPTLGGDERLLVRGGQQPRFSPDGKSIAYCVFCGFQRESKIFLTAVSGGAPKPLAADVPWASAPVFSPDGRHVLFQGASSANAPQSHDWWVTLVQGGPSVKTGLFGALAGQKLNVFNYTTIQKDWLGDRIHFSSGGQIWEIEISPRDWKALGPARQLTSGTGTAASPRSKGSRIAFVSSQFSSHLWKLNIDSGKGKALGELESLPHSGGDQSEPTSSANGHLLAYSQFEPSGNSIRVRNLVSGKETTLVSVRGRPKVSPDGSRVAYFVDPDSIYLVSSSGGEAELLMRTPGSGSILGWTPDGGKILYRTGQPLRSWFLLDPKTRQSTVLLSHPKYNPHTVVLSPDQRWAVFRTSVGRREPLWITPIRDGRAAAEEKDWILLSEGLNGFAWWSPDGNLLYMLSQRDGNECIWAQRLDLKTKRPSGEAFAVYHLHGARLTLIDTAFFGPAILPDGIIFGLGEQTGNVWLAEQ